MKVGEVLVCKKNYKKIKRYHHHSLVVEYKKDKEYKISEFHNKSHSYNPGKHKQHIKISYNTFRFENNNYYFDTDFIDERLKKSQFMNYDYIWDYFYTLKEWRKQKLQKLNEHKN